ncbi:hypothetical protein [Paenibacillus sp. BAC0078]
MKKTMMMKSILAATMLLGAVVGQGSVSHAAGTSPSATAAPVMRDNLSKYGLKKAVELPVTVTSGGFSYTLEKLMIYDVKSKDAQALMKKYGYSDKIYMQPTKYMIWTKITIQNNSKKLIQWGAKDLVPKWFLNMNGFNLDIPTPKLTINKVNNKDALYTWSLKPGEKLTTYQMYESIEAPDSISVYSNFGGGFDQKYIVARPGE